MPRGSRRSSRFGLAAGLSLLVLPGVSGADSPLPESDRFIDVGGYVLHARVTGQGSPPLVFLSGAGAPQTYWDGSTSELAGATRVITYDRAGKGRSEAGPEPRDGATIASELAALLEGLDEPGPFVLVAHSAGCT